MQKYKIVRKIGEGAFSNVFLAVGTDRNLSVAIKIQKNQFSADRNDGSCLREVQALLKIKHEAVIDLLEVFVHNKHLCMVFQYMHYNLYERYLYQQEPTQEKTIKKIIHNIASALNVVHLHGIFHRDLKPENILINESSNSVKLADFGLARSYRTTEPLTDYVSTRWYRAPQLVIKMDRYGAAVDIFALGCIMAELYNCKPLFPGNTELDQLEMIMQKMSIPSSASEWPQFFMAIEKRGLILPKPTPKIPYRIINRNYRFVDPYAHSLLESMLQFNPKRRITAKQILSHAYFQSEKVLNISSIRQSSDHNIPEQVERSEKKSSNSVNTIKVRQGKQKEEKQVKQMKEMKVKAKVREEAEVVDTNSNQNEKTLQKSGHPHPSNEVKIRMKDSDKINTQYYDNFKKVLRRKQYKYVQGLKCEPMVIKKTDSINYYQHDNERETMRYNYGNVKNKQQSIKREDRFLSQEILSSSSKKTINSYRQRKFKLNINSNSIGCPPKLKFIFEGSHSRSSRCRSGPNNTNTNSIHLLKSKLSQKKRYKKYSPYKNGMFSSIHRSLSLCSNLNNANVNMNNANVNMNMNKVRDSNHANININLNLNVNMKNEREGKNYNSRVAFAKNYLGQSHKTEWEREREREREKDKDRQREREREKYKINHEMNGYFLIKKHEKSPSQLLKPSPENPYLI